MEDTGGVIHHTKGIDGSTEFLLLEALADLSGKARPYEEHLLAGTDLEIGLGHINDRPELHLSIINYQLTTADLQACR